MSRAPQRSRQAPVRRPTSSTVLRRGVVPLAPGRDRWDRPRGRGSGFAVEAAGEKPRTAFATPPVGSPSTRFIAQTRALAVDQSIKGWITIDGTDGFDPVALVYADGAEVLRVRFQGDWRRRPRTGPLLLLAGVFDRHRLAL